jgi:hypothetical protein
MPPQLTTATLDEAALRQALSTHATQLTTIYLESETRVVLAPLADYLGPKITLPPVRWLTGRAFGPTLEIRWRLDGAADLFSATALTETTSSPEGWLGSPWNAILDATTRSRNVLLAGVNSTLLPSDHKLFKVQPQGGVWIDMRIPRPLYYPAPNPKAQQLVLQCVDYLSRGLVVITRLCALVAYDAAQDASKK